MEFDGFDWDDGNIAKCQKHGVSIAEIESMFGGTPIVGPDPFDAQLEKRFRAAGRTDAGRALFIVFTWRAKGKEKLIRPISARYMHAKEVKAYEKQISRI